MCEVKLYLGDCLSILPTLAGPIDAIITDLPYGTTACNWDVVIPFAPMWEQVKRLLKPNGVFVTTASQPFTSLLVCSNLPWFRYAWVWEKSTPNGHLDANRKPLKAHEDIPVFYQRQPTYNPQKRKGNRNHTYNTRRAPNTEIYRLIDRTPPDLSGMKYPRSVLQFDKSSSSEDLHPTQKPLALYEYLILTYTNPGDTVLDFCMGSGTTGEAAIRTGRNFIGCEIKPEYYAVAERRIHDAQLQIPMPLVCQ